MYGNSKSLTCNATGRALRRALFGACTILVGGFGAAHAAAPTGFDGLAPVSDAVLAEMRGGFVLPNGMIIAVQIDFYTAVGTPSGLVYEDTESFDEDDLSAGTGVVHSVTVEPNGATPDTPNVDVLTVVNDDISGVMNVIQNNASSVAIQNMTTVNVDLMNTGISLQVFRNNNFSLQMRTLGALGL